MNTASILIDVGFGDSGKGTVTDALTRRYASNLTVRFNGGPQAAHRVVDPNGKDHIFASFGSGTLIPNVRTLLSKHVLINPLNVPTEAVHLFSLNVKDAYSRLFIDERALIITPYHKVMNRALEISRGKSAHGSCGEGIGEAVCHSISLPNMVLRARDLLDKKKTKEVLNLNRLYMLDRFLQNSISFDEPDYADLKRLIEDDDKLVDFYYEFAKGVNIIAPDEVSVLINSSANPIFEGAQGVLLDQDYGFYPYTTWSKTTPANAVEVLKEVGWKGKTETIAILRTYSTRHGPGPFVTENQNLTKEFPDISNFKNRWQGDFRVGWLDLPLLEYALQVAEFSADVNWLAITHLDKLDFRKTWQVCTNYVNQNSIWKPVAVESSSLEYQSILSSRMMNCSPSLVEFNRDEVVKYISNFLEVPILLTSHGAKATDKVFHELKNLTSS